MSTFTVNPDSLDALAAHLENLGHRMLSLQRLPSGDVTSLGGSHVQRSLENFSTGWSDSAVRLNRSVTEMVTHLQQAATAYHDTDTELGSSGTAVVQFPSPMPAPVRVTPVEPAPPKPHHPPEPHHPPKPHHPPAHGRTGHAPPSPSGEATITISPSGTTVQYPNGTGHGTESIG